MKSHMKSLNTGDGDSSPEILSGKHKETGNVWRRAADWLLFLGLPVILFYLFQNFVATPFDGNMEGIHQVFTIWFLELCCVFFAALFGNARRGLFVTGGLCLLIGLADSYIYLFRGSYITPADIFSFGTAMNVAGNYSFVPTARMVVLTVLFLAWFVLASFCRLSFRPLSGDRSSRGKKLWIRAALVLLSALLLFLSGRYVQSEKGIEKFDLAKTLFYSERNNRHNGIVIQAIYEGGLLFVREPEGYSAQREREILSRYDAEGDPAPQVLPDIVVLMDEAFSDPAVFAPVETNEDYMPFVHSLMEGAENTISGYAHVSVRGGNTPNSEFEFLTGHSLAFLPENTIPFLSLIHKRTDALPWYLRSLGYETLAMHPFEAKGWNRPKVYPLLGFEDMHFEEYFEERDPVYVREYISDETQFREVARLTDEREEEDGPLFSFNVTMQNHSWYKEETYPDFERRIRLTDTEGLEQKEITPLENYLSLVRYTDEALEELIRHYESSDRPTLVVFFGDHQPATSNFEAVFKKTGEDYRHLPEDRDNLRNAVPFLIWANFDMEEKTGVQTSLNYLGNLALEAAGIPLPPYRRFTEEFSEKYPIISSVRSEDSGGISTPMIEAKPSLIEYDRMQYYKLFDEPQELYSTFTIR